MDQDEYIQKKREEREEERRIEGYYELLEIKALIEGKRGGASYWEKKNYEKRNKRNN